MKKVHNSEKVTDNSLVALIRNKISGNLYTCQVIHKYKLTSSSYLNVKEHK